MGNFFHGWRWKVGVVTLWMACVFMGGWIRGQSTVDELYFGKGKGIHSFSLFFGRNGITLTRRTTEESRTSNPNWYCGPLEPRESFYIFQPGLVVEWRWHSCGFEAGEFHDLEMPIWRMSWWNTPYWSLVIPLTLLSAWLLLSNSRSSNQNKTPESITEKVS